MHHIFSGANNREIYEDQQKNLYPKQQIKQLSGLTEVRWSCRYEGVNTVINTIKAILVSLQLIANGNSNTADQAAGTYHKIMSSSFITSMVFLHNILAITDGLNKHLQEVNVDFVVAQGELNVCKKLLADLSVEKVEKKSLIYVRILISTQNMKIRYMQQGRHYVTTLSCPRLMVKLKLLISCQNLKILLLKSLLKSLIIDLMK